MNTTRTFIVYKLGMPVAAGSLLDCWQHLFNRYSNMMRPHDLAEAEICIAPTGDVKQHWDHLPSGTYKWDAEKKTLTVSNQRKFSK